MKWCVAYFSFKKPQTQHNNISNNTNNDNNRYLLCQKDVYLSKVLYVPQLYY